MENNKVKISEILGQNCNLYYYNEMNCFQLGSVIFEVIEDEIDGYRSAMNCLKIKNTDAQLKQFIAKVKIVDISTDDNNIYALQDEKNENFNWVEFGTENTNDYYPYFVFRTNVKSENEISEINEIKNMNEIIPKLKL